VVTGIDRPNGLAFSPDERILYVSDTSLSETPAIHAFPVAEDGRVVGKGRVFAVADAGLFDGFRLDRAGNLWTSSGDGVRVYAADGTLLGRINVPETVSNLCFGGPKRNRLYITATSSLYAVYVHAAPADRP
jgi:gluconolactonase